MKKLIFGIGMIIAGIIGVLIIKGMTLLLFVPILIVLPFGFIAGAIDGKDYPKKKAGDEKSE